MGTLNLTDPQNGTPTDAAVIAANNAAIKAVVNGGIDATNIAAAAAILASQLSGYPTDGTKFLAGDGTWKTALGTVYRKNTAQDVNGSVAETDLLASSVTLPGNTLTATGILTATLWGDLLNNTGGAANVTWKIKLGATTMWGTSQSVSTAGATRLPWVLRFTIAAMNSTSSQFLAGDLVTSKSPGVAGSVAGIGVFDENNTRSGAVFASNGTTAVNMTTSQALQVTVTNSTSSASQSTRLQGALITVQ